MLMSFHWHDYVTAAIACGAMLGFIVLLIWNGYDDYRNGRLTSTWRKPNE
jgi:hypothetical protein